MADRPEVERLAADLRAEQRAVMDERPRGVVVTGDVQQALMPVVQHELAAVLDDINREELATLRWLCNWEPETVARIVVMIQRAGGVHHA